MSGALNRILMVEDDADIRTVAEMALTLVGAMTVRVCASGVEALEAIDAFAPQLVLLDVMMPEMDGPTVLARLRERPGSARIPVVFMTAKAQSDEIAHLRALGALGVVAKPFDPMTLAATLGEIWERRDHG